MQKRSFSSWLRQRTGVSIAQLWGITLLGGIFIFINTHPIRPHDFWWHLRAGEVIATTHHIPRYDTYSSTMHGAPYPYAVYWLAELGMYLVYITGGPALTIFLCSLLITTGYALLYRQCHIQSHNRRVAALCLFIAVALGINSWNIRPQTITFFLGAVFLSTMATYARHPRPLLLLIFPLTMLVWVNSHGSFPIGLILLALWSLDTWTTRRTAARPLWPDALIALLLTVLAGLANPQGAGIVRYLVGMGQNPAVQKLVPEWAAPSLHSPEGILFYSLLALGGLLFIFTPRRPRPAQFLTFAVFGVLSIRTARGIPWFGLTMAPLCADLLPPLLTKSGLQLTESPPTPLMLRINRLYLALLGLGMLGTLPWFKSYLPLPEKKAGLISTETPLLATTYLLQARCPTPIFNEVGFGSYLIWAAQPDYPVFVDPRIDLYPLDLWLDYIHISAAVMGWEERLEKYGVRTLMLSPQEQAGLVKAAQEAEKWHVVYKDDVSIILVRQE